MKNLIAFILTLLFLSCSNNNSENENLDVDANDNNSNQVEEIDLAEKIVGNWSVSGWNWTNPLAFPDLVNPEDGGLTLLWELMRDPDHPHRTVWTFDKRDESDSFGNSAYVNGNLTDLTYMNENEILNFWGGRSFDVAVYPQGMLVANMYSELKWRPVEYEDIPQTYRNRYEAIFPNKIFFSFEASPRFGYFVDGSDENCCIGEDGFYRPLERYIGFFSEDFNTFYLIHEVLETDSVKEESLSLWYRVQ